MLGAAANGVSDNPLIFGDDILSGGNFHAEPIGFVSDFLAIAVAELASIAERRIDLLDRRVNPNLNMFLASEPGLESGFMMAHVTAAALVSENKTLAHPASVDSLPTSAGQEDHVSMAPWAGRKLLAICANASRVLGIELLAAARAVDAMRPLATTPELEQVHALVREHVPQRAHDHRLDRDIETLAELVRSRRLVALRRVDAVRPVLVVLAAFAVVIAAARLEPLARRPALGGAGHLLLAIAASAVVTVALPLTRLSHALRDAARRTCRSPNCSSNGSRRAAIASSSRACRPAACRSSICPGDQWRLDVDAPRWATWSAPLGLEPRYRIERLSSRPAGPAGEDPSGTADATSRTLAADTGPPPGSQASGHGRGEPLLAPRVIHGQWQPMVPGGRLAVRLTNAGQLVVDPVNAPASDALAAR